MAKKKGRKKAILTPIVEAWLNEFKGKSTRDVYRSILRVFRNYVGMSLDSYLKTKRDFLADFKNFISYLDKTPKTVSLYSNVVKQFLKENKAISLTEDEWRKIRKRQKIVSVAVTVDKAPTKAELRRILNYLDVRGRALVLFLSSSGARIGETVQIELKDLNLNSEPPKALIRHKATKGSVGGRTVRLSFEARDALRDWLGLKDNLKKKDGKLFDKKLVFPFTTTTAREIWNRAIDKAALGERDSDTNRRILHIHSLRKFFRSKIGLDFDLTNALMGHNAYLDRSYRRLNEDDIDKAYLRAMKNVSVYTATRSRKEEVSRALAMSGTSVKEILELFSEEMYKGAEGMGGGVSRKLPIDEDYIFSLEDEEIGKYVFKALKRKLLGEAKANGAMQKVISEDELEAYLEKGWMYVSSLNNGSGKCIVKRA